MGDALGRVGIDRALEEKYGAVRVNGLLEDHPPLCDTCVEKRRQRRLPFARTVYSRRVAHAACVDCGQTCWSNGPTTAPNPGVLARYAERRR